MPTPLNRQFECLLALRRLGNFEDTARACRLSVPDLIGLLREAENTYGRPLVKMTSEFDGFTPMGEVVLTCARRLSIGPEPDSAPAPRVEPAEAGAATEDESSDARLAALLRRRSVSPKRLGAPGPNATQIEQMLQAALCAPDHGSLRPWRVIEFRSEARPALADLFEQEKLRRDPLASAADLRLSREHATRAPALLGVVVSPKQRSKVPMREQWLAAGAALGNLLNAAHQLGFGAIVLSGERCYDGALLSQLGVQPDEFLAGFVSIGTVMQAPPARKPTLPGAVWSCWSAELRAPHDASAPSTIDPRDGA